jgi:hypothetical protein
VGVDVDEIVFATLPDQRTLKNLRRDPPIALSAPTTTLNQWALLEYLVVYGTSRVTEGGVAESPPTSSALASENPSKRTRWLGKTPSEPLWGIKPQTYALRGP